MDELRRDASCIVKGTDNEICMELFHDSCVVQPGELNIKVRFENVHFERDVGQS